MDIIAIAAWRRLVPAGGLRCATFEENTMNMVVGEIAIRPEP